MGVVNARTVAVAAVAGLAATAAAQFDNSPWPGFRGTADKRGAVNAPGPAINLAFTKPDFGTVTPGGFTLSANGDVYFKAYAEGFSRVYRLDPATGNVLGMSNDFGGNTGNYAGVAVGVDAVYTCHYAGAGATSILKLDKSTLAVIDEWTDPAFVGLRGTPLLGSVNNNQGRPNIYVADRNANMIHAVDSATGALQWSYATIYPTIFDQLGPMWTTQDGKQAFAHFGNGNFGPGTALKDNGDGTFTPLWEFQGPGNFNWWGSGALGANGDRIYVTTFRDPIPPSTEFTDALWAIDINNGTVIWSAGRPDSNHFGRPSVVGNRIYCGNHNGGVVCYEDQGASATVAWSYNHADPGEFTSVSVAVTPGGERYIYALQQETTLEPGKGRLVVLRDMGSSASLILDTTLNGDLRWSLFSNNGGTIDAQGSLWVHGGRVDDPTPGTIYKFGVGAAPCYPNCDNSTNPPILNVNDFICFQSAFAAGDPYANCDNSTSPPVLNVNDFICFQSAFAAGCQ